MQTALRITDLSLLQKTLTGGLESFEATPDFE